MAAKRTDLNRLDTLLNRAEQLKTQRDRYALLESDLVTIAAIGHSALKVLTHSGPTPQKPVKAVSRTRQPKVASKSKKQQQQQESDTLTNIQRRKLEHIITKCVKLLALASGIESREESLNFLETPPYEPHEICFLDPSKIRNSQVVEAFLEDLITTPVKFNRAPLPDYQFEVLTLVFCARQLKLQVESLVSLCLDFEQVNETGRGGSRSLESGSLYSICYCKSGLSSKSARHPLVFQKVVHHLNDISKESNFTSLMLKVIPDFRKATDQHLKDINREAKRFSLFPPQLHPILSLLESHNRKLTTNRSTPSEAVISFEPRNIIRRAAKLIRTKVITSTDFRNILSLYPAVSKKLHKKLTPAGQQAFSL